MALIYNEDQQMLKDSAVGFFGDRSPVTAFRALRDSGSERGFEASLWQEMADMGFTSVLLSEEEGGAGFGYVGAGIVAESMATTLAASPFIASAIVGLDLLKAVDSPLVSAVADGSKIATLAIDESGHFNPSMTRTKAVEDGGQWQLKGMKTFVPEGSNADYILVTAALDVSRTGLFLVEAGAANLITDRTAMADSRNWAKLSFEGTPATLLEADASALIGGALDKANVVLSAELLGLSQAAFDMTVAYLKERKQFGKIIGTFQGLQHRAAHLFSEIEVTRSMVLSALQALDAGAPNAAVMASAAKARACKTAELATNEAIQLHGGIGMTDEYDVGFYIKRARALQNLYGGYTYHCDRFAALSGY